METRPLNSKRPRPPLTYRKLFHRGIVFWLLVWMIFVCTQQVAWVQMKGGGYVELAIGDGAVSATPCLVTGFQPEEMKWMHTEIWTGYRPRLISKYPEFLIGSLARIGTKPNYFVTEYSFPIPGFLILWLAAGLYGEMKLIRYPAAMPVGVPNAIVGSRNRIVMLMAAMLALIAVVAVADHMLREEKVARSCAGSIIDIRYFLWGKHVGDSVRWDQYWGAGDALRPQDRKCPSGAPYQFFPVQSPRDGAQCSRADHRRYLEGAY